MDRYVEANFLEILYHFILKYDRNILAAVFYETEFRCLHTKILWLAEAPIPLRFGIWENYVFEKCQLFSQNPKMYPTKPPYPTRPMALAL